MAIKTQTELSTQSDNTFIDNTTGLIIPTNHRQWNDDVLDTMFGGIAGRLVTKAEFDDLLANSELIVGTTYFIVAYPIGNINVTLQVMALNSSEAIITSMCDASDTGHVLKNVNDVSDAKIVKSFGTGLGISSIGSMISNELALGVFGVGAELNLNINDTLYPYKGLVARCSYDVGNSLLRHNLLAQHTAKQHYWKGFLPQDVPNSGNYFYPDHGSQNTWGTANITNGAEDGYIDFSDASNIASFSDVKANFQKVNNMIFGMLEFGCTIDFSASPITCEFSLPYMGETAGWDDTITGNGISFVGTNHAIFISVFKSSTPNTQKAKMSVNLIGTHNQIDDVVIRLNFSYSLDPA